MVSNVCMEPPFTKSSSYAYGVIAVYRIGTQNAMSHSHMCIYIYNTNFMRACVRYTRRT